MILRRVDRFSGILSVLWTIGGYWLLTAYSIAFPASRTLAGAIIFAVIIFGWLGCSLLLVIAGLRRGDRFERICSALAALSLMAIVFYVTEPFHNMIRKTENLFRKDEYANVYYGAPECDISVSIHGPVELEKFHETVRQFAKQQEIRECRQKRYMQYSGPPRPAFKGVHVAIWWSPGGLRLGQYDEAYSTNEFKHVADKLAQAMQSAFPGRVEISFKGAYM